MFSLDIFLFLIFIALNLGVGLWYSRGSHSLKSYAVGDRNFPTMVLAMSIVATIFGGSMFASGINYPYKEGLLGIIRLALIGLGFFLFAKLAFRSGEFLGKTSTADVLGSVYGKEIKYFTSFIILFAHMGVVAIQFKLIGYVLERLLGMNPSFAIWLAGGLVIFYSSLGGFRAVTFTDVLQFSTLFLLLPLLAIFILYGMGRIDPGPKVDAWYTAKEALLTVPKQNFMTILGLGRHIWAPMIIVPVFQRILATKNVHQARRSLNYAAVLWSVLALLMIWIGILLQKHNPTIDSTKGSSYLLEYIMENCNLLGLKGAMAIGLVAICMSTADSFLNTSSVILIDALPDFYKRKKKITQGVNLLLGFLSILLAFLFFKKDFRALWNSLGAFFPPVITVPLLATLAGFRTSRRVIAWGMGLSILTTIGCLIGFGSGASGTYIRVPGVLASCITIFSLHYLLGEPGGWGHIKQDRPLIQERELRNHRWRRIKKRWASFSGYDYCLQLQPKGSEHHFLLGIYGLLISVIGFLMVPHSFVKAHATLLVSSMVLSLLLCSLLATYGGWPSLINKRAQWVVYGYPLAIGVIFFFLPAMFFYVSGSQPLLLALLLTNGAIALFLLTPLLTLAIGAFAILAAYDIVYFGGAMPSTGYYAYCGEELVLLAMLLIGGGYFLYKFKHALIRQKTSTQRAWQAYKIYSDRYQKLRRVQEEYYQDLLEGVHAAMQRATQHGEVSMADELTKTSNFVKQKSAQLGSYLTMDYTTSTLPALCEELESYLQSIPDMPAVVCQPCALTSRVTWDKERVFSLIESLLQQQFPKDENLAFFIYGYHTHIVYDEVKNRTENAIALRIVQGVVKNLPQIETHYIHDQKENHPSGAEDLYRTVDAHYGILEVNKEGGFITLVLPHNLKAIRPKIIDDKPSVAFSEEQKIVLEKVRSSFLNKYATWAGEIETPTSIDRVKRAIHFMKRKHAHDLRKNGDPFATHCLVVASKVLDYSHSEDEVIAALLHDVVEDTTTLLSDVEMCYGKEVATMVNLVSSMHIGSSKKYKNQKKSDQANIIADCGHRGAQLIKLCDRVHNMETLDAMLPEKQEQKCQETRKYFIPVAKKLGLQEITDQLETLCSKYEK